MLTGAMTACGDDDGGTDATPEAATLQKSVPANGEKDVATTTKTIELTFTKEVNFASGKEADFNGTKYQLTSFSKSGNTRHSDTAEEGGDVHPFRPHRLLHDERRRGRSGGFLGDIGRTACCLYSRLCVGGRSGPGSHFRRYSQRECDGPYSVRSPDLVYR